MADKLLQEIIDIGSHADCDIRSVSVCISPFELDAVNASDVINIYGIAVLYLTVLHLFCGGIRRSDRFDLFLNFLITYIYFRFCENGVLIIRQCDTVRYALIFKIAFFIEAHGKIRVFRRRNGLLRLCLCAGSGLCFCRSLGTLCRCLIRGAGLCRRSRIGCCIARASASRNAHGAHHNYSHHQRCPLFHVYPPGSVQDLPAEQDCKPGSVVNDHLSTTAVAGSLKRPTREQTGRLMLPVWSCFGWGLQCPARYRTGGSLLHCLFNLTGYPAVCFLLHFPWSRLHRPLTGILPCEARTFLIRRPFRIFRHVCVRDHSSCSDHLRILAETIP